MDCVNQQETKNETQTFGEKAVGSTFNPSQNKKVNKVKRLYAEIIDILHNEQGDRRDEGSRHLSIAITDAETAQMRAVKGMTWVN